MQSKFIETLHDCIVDGIRYVIGESGMKAVLFHIELGHYIDDPGEFHRNLYTVFKEGSIVLEKVIVKELFRRLNVPYQEKDNFDFARYVTQARELFMARQKEIRSE